MNSNESKPDPTFAPGNVKPYDTLWAILSVDEKGNEGICQIMTAMGPQVAVTGDMRNLEMYKKIVKGQGEQEAKDAGLRIVVAKYKRSDTKDL